MKVKEVVMCLAAAFAGIASGDQVKLSNGTVIIGEVKQVFGGKVKIATDFAGELTVDAVRVSSIVTDKSVNVATDGGKLSGRISEAGIVNSESNSASPVDIKNLKALWQDGAIDPTLPKPPEKRKWEYEAAFDIAGKEGNTTKLTLGGSLKATLSGPQDKLLLYARGKHDRENHLTSEKSLVMGADYENRIAGTSNSWYARSEYKYDKYNDLDPMWTSAAGYGFYVLDKEDVKIRLRAGLSYVYKDYLSEKDTESNVGLDANYHHEIKLKKLGLLENLGVLVTDVTWTPVFDDFNDYRLYHESSVSIPLNGSKYWSIRLGISQDYYNRVAEDKKHLDTTYFARLVFTWK